MDSPRRRGSEGGPLRKWLIRSAILLPAAGMAGAAWLYHTWTRPEVVRQLLLRQLQEQLDGVEIRLDSARLRLLGGISFSGLELRRAGDPDGEPFLTIPSGRVYHDKQALGNGRLVVRKLELEEPHLRLRRREDGTWNTSGLFRPGAAGGPLPVVVVRRATVTVEDAARPGEGDVVRDGFLTLVNDPDPQVSFECHAVSDLLGPLTVSGRANRSSGEARAELTLSGFRIGAALLERLKAYAPRLAAPPVTCRWAWYCTGGSAPGR